MLLFKEFIVVEAPDKFMPVGVVLKVAIIAAVGLFVWLIIISLEFAVIDVLEAAKEIAVIAPPLVKVAEGLKV